MMRCQNCGIENTEGAKFCAKCGGPLTVDTAVQATPVQPQQNVGGAAYAQPNGTVNKPAKSFNFNIVDIFKTMLDSIIHPMKAYKKLSEDSIANCGIYAGFLLLVVTVFNLLVFVIWCAAKDMFKYKFVKGGDIVAYGFSILGYLALFLALAAFIYKVASLFMKKDIEFKKIAVGVLVGFTTAIAARYILTIFGLFLNGKFFAYLLGTINIFALLYSIFYTIKIVTKDFGSDDEKGILLNIICLTILFALSTYVLADWFTALTKFFSAGILTL